MSAKTFWSAIAILAILLIISIVVLSLRLHDYTKKDEHAVSLRSSMDESLDVFNMEYKNDSGEITVKGHEGEKIIAPGTDVEYTLRLRNTDNVALDYSFTPNLKYTSEYELPIVVRLLDSEDNYVIGNETTWVALDDIGDAKCSGTLMKNETAEYVFQWKWPFESGDDKYDSFLGEATFEGDIGVELSFGLHAETNTTVTANGGFASSPSGKITLIVVIFLLLAAAITLLIIHIILKIEAKKNEKPTIVEVPVVKIIEKIIEVPVMVAATATKVKEAKPSFTGKMAHVNIDTLEKTFKSGSRITIGALKNKGIVPKSAKQIKILARSSASLTKVFVVETQGISKHAEEAIKNAGGRVIITAPDTEM